ncbi:MAG: cell wall hydrolase [Clostridiales bacterium]|nr:cell wall hydrolase [Clostridiales bacterium]
MTMDELELLARLIKCEAGGEGESGMRAVASVLMNRVNMDRGEYGRYNTIRDVIFAPRQFECATDQPQSIFNLTPEPIHYDIAQWAINGGRLSDTADALWFFNPYSSTCRSNFPNQNGYLRTRIGNHCFYSPNSSYYNT